MIIDMSEQLQILWKLSVKTVWNLKHILVYYHIGLTLTKSPIFFCFLVKIGHISLVVIVDVKDTLHSSDPSIIMFVPKLFCIHSSSSTDSSRAFVI